MKHSGIYIRVVGLACLLMLGMFPVKAQTFDLHTIEPDVVPAGSILEWHNAVPVTAGNLVANTTAVNAGIYYAVYKNGSCYSVPSPFKIVKTDCGTDSTDLYKSVDTADKPSGTVLTFHTAKPVSLSNLYAGNAHVAQAGTYYAAYYDPAKDCYTLGTPVKVIPNIVCGTNPDFNITHINVPVSGNVHTNDNVPAGTTYGTPAGNPGNPTAAVPVMNPDGSYTFTPTDTGVYVFGVPVCSSDTTVGCVMEQLVITVTDPYVDNNPPIVNPDVAVVDSGSSVTIPVLVNDQPGNPGGHFGPPTATDPPNGTVTVTPGGAITYTPDPGFIGTDTFTYTVCDTAANPDLCRSATVTVNVSPYPSPNTILAGDDFVKIPMFTAATGNVIINDIDPDGDPMSVTPQNVTIAGIGTFTLDNMGNYTFVPADTFFGPVQLSYTVCDTAGNCATATLHILVDPVNTSNPDFNITHINVPVEGNVSQNDNIVPGTHYGNPVANAGNPSNEVPSMQTDGNYTFTPTAPGVYVFNVPVCPPGIMLNCPVETLTITVTNPYQPGSNPPVANPDIAAVDSGGTVDIPVLDNDQPGNPGGQFGPPTVTDPPNGTVTVTPDGEIVYTPDPGFTGVDTFTYTVCDTSVTPSLCGTASVTVNVNPPGTANTILANDDYVNVDMNTIATGNVMNNDMDPDGDPIAVTPQNITLSAGTFIVDASGDYTFTPNAGFYGPVQVTYTVCDTAGNCVNATLHILVDPVNILEPDFNVTDVGVTVSGDIFTNDEIVQGSVSGSPVMMNSNPATDMPVMNSNGTYSFTAAVPGIYKFEVPVCAPSQNAPCPMEMLTITVLEPAMAIFPPVVNPDNATGLADSTITIHILTNDDPTSPGGSLGNPVIATQPSNGSVTVNTDGTVDYTLAPGFTGIDSFVYTVCDTALSPQQCGSATVMVHILPPDAINTVATNDDYISTYGTVPVTGNVLLNDNDPEGGILTATPQNITTAQGTLSLLANGNYTFTPAAGFVGTTSFVYTACDNGEPQACDQATLHVLVDKAPDYTPQVIGQNLGYYGADSVHDYIITISNLNNIRNKGPVQFYIQQSLPYMEIMIDTAATSVNYIIPSFPVANADWHIQQVGDYFIFTLKNNVLFNPGTSKYIGITTKVLPNAPLFQTFSLTSTIVNGSGGDTDESNNSYNLNIYKN